MAEYKPVYLRPLSRGAILLLAVGVLGVILVRYYGTGKRDYQRKSVVIAQAAAIDWMREMQLMDERSELTQRTSLQDVTRREDWSWGRFDASDVTMQMRGHKPRYAGTTFHFESENLYRPVTITVTDLSRTEFEVETEPVPEWWEFWK